MKLYISVMSLILLCFLGCETPVEIQNQEPSQGIKTAFKKGPPTSEDAGNNLSYPVIWAEGVQKTLPGASGMTPVLNGAWWYWWGTTGIDPDVTPLSCAPDPDDQALCDDGIPMQATGDPPGEPWVKAYLQKDPNNVWQAGSVDWSGQPVHVDWIDWGDNLESVDWYTRSQVRTEVVLFKDLMIPMREYEMRHVSGWGIDEVHGLAATATDEPLRGPGTQATIYSPCARLTIQKLLVAREDVPADALVWVPAEGWTEADPAGGLLINGPIFNDAVYLGGDGPGYYSAEINVKGRIIYGYTWNVRRLNDSSNGTPAGDYRATFSFDASCGGVGLNTFFVSGVTEIMRPIEEITEESSETGGGVAQLDVTNNLTYIDVRILERGGGKGGQRP